VIPAAAIQILGMATVAVTLLDVFLTVLHPRADAGLLSPRLNRMVWLSFRAVGALFGPWRDRLLCYAGPALLAATAAMWVGLLTVGFALIYWPGLGTAIASYGETPRDFATALYYSGTCLTTLGFGDLLPQTGFFRLVSVFEAGCGLTVLTLSLTYLLSIYSALIRRNAFVLELDFASGGRGDAADMLVGLAGGEGVRATRHEFAMMGRELLNLLQAHHSFPAIHYFRRRETAYATARAALLTLDAASLVRSVIDCRRYEAFVRSSAIELFWRGGLQLVRETATDVLPAAVISAEIEHPHAAAWRRRYADAHAKLAAAGIEVEPDPATGAEQYVALRRQWDGYVRAFADYMAYPWWRIDPRTAQGAD
jgi:hypothetical protein